MFLATLASCGCTASKKCENSWGSINLRRFNWIWKRGGNLSRNKTAQRNSRLFAQFSFGKPEVIPVIIFYLFAHLKIHSCLLLVLALSLGQKLAGILQFVTSSPKQKAPRPGTGLLLVPAVPYNTHTQEKAVLCRTEWCRTEWCCTTSHCTIPNHTKQPRRCQPYQTTHGNSLTDRNGKRME